MRVGQAVLSSRPKQSKLKRTLKDLNNSKYLLLLLLPCFVYFVIFKYWPMFGLIISFKDYNLFKGVMDSPWVGFKHYINFFSDPYFIKVLRNTFLLGVYNTLWNFPMPVIAALVINEIKGNGLKKLTQTVSFFPHFVSVVTICGMAIGFLSPRNGIINEIVKFFGGDPINFMTDPKYFRTIYIATGIWQNTGWGTIVYLAALSGINSELYDAAAVDGVNKWQELFYVTLPSILPTVILLLIMNIGRAVTVGFEKVFLLQTDANISISEVISTYEYERGMVQANYSYSTAIGLFMSVVSSSLVVGANFISRKVSDTSLW